jgi:PPOX class probable F420-dependent enzyme
MVDQAPVEDWRGKNRAMSQEDLAEHFAKGIICRLATLDDEGWPYVVPVWFEFDAEDGGFWFIPRKKSAWALHIQRDPRVSFTIDDEGAPHRRIMVQGRGQIVEEPNVGGRWVPIGERMSLRYLGPNGPDYLVPTLDQPRWLIKVMPERVTTWQGVNWAKRYREA